MMLAGEHGLPLRQQIPSMLKWVECHQAYLDFNSVLFDVYEGELLKYIQADLRKQLSEQSYAQVAHRIAPINVLVKVVDKLSKIYQQDPSRSVERPKVDGASEPENDQRDEDSELLAWYAEKMSVNHKMNVANEFFNLFKASLVQPYVHRGVPSLRIIPNDRFIVMSTDPVEPTRPTHVIIPYGTKEKCTTNPRSKAETYRTVRVYHAHTDMEFLIFNSDQEVEIEDMRALGNEDGVNIFGRLTFTYVNRSNNLLIPKADRDGFQITKLIPILFSDLNFAVMFQAFSIIYGINIDEQVMTMAPNSFWRFKSDDKAEGKAEIGTIKPEVDISEVIELIRTIFSLWLNTKGIQAGAVGQADGNNFASGISKILDEMDTSEDRQRQVSFFKTGEQDLWDLILNYMHPVWVKSGMIENKATFSADASVKTNFAEQVPTFGRGKLVEDLDKEVGAGFMPRSEAIHRLNPHKTEKELVTYMARIDNERIEIVDMDKPADEEDDDDDQS